MKTALAVIVALSLAVTSGCQCFSCNSKLPSGRSCSDGLGVNCYEEQGNHLWEPGTPGGIGCEGQRHSARCGCAAGGCHASCGIESTACAPGCGVESTGCAMEPCCGVESPTCAFVPGCGVESTAVGAGCAGGCATADSGHLAPVINAPRLSSGGGGVGCDSHGRMAGRLAARGGAFGEARGFACPNCGGPAGIGGCRACGLLQHAATACAGGGCGLSPGPEQGSVMYPYYTLRGPRDFLMRNPPSIGP